MTSRPCAGDEAIVRKVAEAMAESLMIARLDDGGTPRAQVVADVMEALALHSDGYARAQFLSARDWRIDASMVSILDDDETFAGPILREAVWKWVADEGIVADASVGDMVMFDTRLGQCHLGVVVGIDSNAATYFVDAPDGGVQGHLDKWPVPFEDVIEVTKASAQREPV